MEVLFSSTRSNAFWLEDIYLQKICTSNVSNNKKNCLKKYVTEGGHDVQFIFCDMHVFHFSEVYFCTTYIFKNVEKQNFYFWIHIYISTKKKKKKKKKTEESVHPRKRAEPLMLWRN